MKDYFAELPLDQQQAQLDAGMTRESYNEAARMGEGKGLQRNGVKERK